MDWGGEMFLGDGGLTTRASISALSLAEAGRKPVKPSAVCAGEQAKLTTSPALAMNSCTADRGSTPYFS